MNRINKECSIAQTYNQTTNNNQTLFSEFKEKNLSLQISLELQKLLINRRTNKLRYVQDTINGHHILSREMFKTNKLPFQQYKNHQPKIEHPPISNINMLKKHAAMLMNQEIKKLGKQNLQEIKVNNSIKDIKRNQNEEINRQNMSSYNHICKKRNKRKILKGRPDMYAAIKRRNILTQPNEEEMVIKAKNKSKDFLNDALNDNNLLNYVKNKAKIQVKQKNLSNVISNQWQQSKNNAKIYKNNFRRTSLATLTHFQNSMYTLKGQIRNIQLINEREMGYAQKYPIKNRRYLSVNTNE